MSTNDIGLKILMALRERGWEQKELAHRANISEGAISYYIANKRSPKFEFLARIARALNKPISYFTSESEEIKLLLNGENTQALGLRFAPVFKILDQKLTEWLENARLPGDFPVSEPTNSRDPKAFFLRVHDEYMTGRVSEKHNISIGDLLLVEPGREVMDGDVCLCWQENKGARLGRYKKYEEDIYLLPLNENDKPITLKAEARVLYFPVTEIITPLK